MNVMRSFLFSMSSVLYDIIIMNEQTFSQIILDCPRTDCGLDSSGYCEIQSKRVWIYLLSTLPEQLSFISGWMNPVNRY